MRDRGYWVNLKLQRVFNDVSKYIVGESEPHLLVYQVPGRVRTLEYCLSLHLLWSASTEWQVKHDIGAKLL